MSIIEKKIKQLSKYEIQWCNIMGFMNPYVDPFEYFISKKIPDFDGQAFYKYRDHNFVYDKLWVAQSQGLLAGDLDKLNENKNIELPIFIKPRWGHETASSKNCFKIKSWSEINNYKNIPDMMWSEFIDAKEQMTDYFLINGQIVYQITYIYSDSQNEFIDEWKYIDCKSKPIPKITDWVNTHMVGFTGAVNVQYRDDKIIEVGLRLARGGAYILSTKNKYLIENINNIADKGIWEYNIENKMKFTPFYSFKCYSTAPLIYVYPQYVLDYIMNKHNCMPFYEYYFEPSGKNGMVVLQFMHKNFEEGMKAKKHFESMINMAQYTFIFLFLFSLIMFFFNKTIGIIMIIIVGILFNTRFINPMGTQISHWKATKQILFS
tara:strand:+ start:47 stop:1177 length:1131 start_codon:yes stop_codon:yes gene_type:complete